jgi:hypothetical protein
MLKEFIDRIKCKIFICCKSKCSLNTELIEEIEQKKHYDYYSQKEKKFSSTSLPTYK